MAAPESWLVRLGLAALWWAVAAALLAAAGLLAAGAVAGALALAGTELGELQRHAWLGLARTVAGQALAPLALWTVALWLALAARWPGIDRRWRSLAGGLWAVALAGFAPVGLWIFTAWRPHGPLDVLGTLLLVSGGVAAALLVARRLVPPLRPGALAPAAPRVGAARGR